ELERHPHGVAGMELAQIAHVHLGGEAGLLARLDVIEAAADELEGLIHRAIEQHVVIGHVEMAVVVDPAGLDPHQRGHERGEEYGFEIATVQHGATLRWAARGRPHRPSTFWPGYKDLKAEFCRHGGAEREVAHLGPKKSRAR